MAKKYYWLKLKKDFFNQKEMKKLRKIAGGEIFTIIYLKMQLISLTEDGVILFAETETDIYEQLSIELDENEDDIKLTISFLINHNLAELTENNDLVLNETKELIGSETSSAKRVRNHREKKLKQRNLDKKALHCNTNVINCNTEIEIEKELEIDIEYKKENIKRKKDSKVVEKYFDNPKVNTKFNEFLEMRKEMKNKATPTAIKALVKKLNEYDDQTKLLAIQKSIESNYRGIFPESIKKQNDKHQDVMDQEYLNNL